MFVLFSADTLQELHGIINNHKVEDGGRWVDKGAFLHGWWSSRRGRRYNSDPNVINKHTFRPLLSLILKCVAAIFFQMLTTV
jgi:hypothetical protein